MNPQSWMDDQISKIYRAKYEFQETILKYLVAEDNPFTINGQLITRVRNLLELKSSEVIDLWFEGEHVGTFMFSFGPNESGIGLVFKSEFTLAEACSEKYRHRYQKYLEDNQKKGGT